MASESSSSKQRGNFSIIIASVFVLFIGVTAVQVFLNRPDTRAQVACYNLAVIHDLFWVGPVKIFAPDDLVLQVKQSRDVHNTYKGCVQFLGRQTWLRSF